MWNYQTKSKPEELPKEESRMSDSVLCNSAGNENQKSTDLPKNKESEIRRQLMKELTAFLKIRGSSDKPKKSPRKIDPDTTSPAQKKKKASFIKKMYRVPFHLRCALLIWYIYWLSSQLDYINSEAEQIKHNAVVICNSSESSVNMVLSLSHNIAVDANIKANLEIKKFVNSTSEMVVDGLDVIYFIVRESINLFTKRIRCVIGSVASMVDVYTEEFADATKSIEVGPSDLFPDVDIPYTGISLKLWNVVVDTIWSNALEATQTAVSQLANLQLSDKLGFIENFADSILDQLDPTRYGIQQDLQNYLSNILPDVNFEAPPKQTVSYCGEINWKEFDMAVDFIKIGIYISLALISVLLATIVTTKWIWIYKKETMANSRPTIVTRTVRYFVKDKARLITAFLGIYGIAQIFVEIYLLDTVSERIHVFTETQVRPTAQRAADGWNNAEASIWEPYINGTNSYIMEIEGDSQNYLSKLQYYVKNQTSILQNSRSMTQSVIYDNLGQDFGNIIMKAIECTTPLFMIDDFLNEVIDYLATRRIDLPTLDQPTIFQVSNETINNFVDKMDEQVEKFVEWYSASIRKHIPFYAFLAIYGSCVFLYDIGELVYKKIKYKQATELPIVALKP